VADQWCYKVERYMGRRTLLRTKQDPIRVTEVVASICNGELHVNPNPQGDVQFMPVSIAVDLLMEKKDGDQE